VNAIGAIGGIIIGLVVCLVQEHFGLLKLGNGSEYVISAYPVSVRAWDILFVISIVFLLSLISVWIPVRKIQIKQ
jgi:lipoprotein-releasing system permease protein